MRLKERGFRRFRPATLAGLPENGQEVSIEDVCGGYQRASTIALARRTGNRRCRVNQSTRQLTLPVRQDVSHFVTTYSNRWRNCSGVIPAVPASFAKRCGLSKSRRSRRIM